jgi:hypothetical protein
MADRSHSYHTLRVVIRSARVVCLGIAIATSSASATEPAIETPAPAEVEKHLPAGKTLDGRELYDRLMKNRRRLRTVYQEGRIISTDPGGRQQQTNFWLQSKDYRDANDDPIDGVYAKVLFKLTGPREMRHTGYLYIHNDQDQDAQFMYSPNRGRVTRVILKGQNLAGTDFSFDDFLVSLDDIEDATYTRHADATVQGVPCYVVEAHIKPSSRTHYSRNLAYLEKEHYVPLKTRYWDEVGVAVKELTSRHDSIKAYDGAWVPTQSTMANLLEETESLLHIDVLDPNPDIDDRDFAVSSLMQHP